MNRLNKFSQEMYLTLLIAENYSEQEPAYKSAKWYHLFWLLIPIIGFLFFIIIIETKYNKEQKNK